MCRVVSCRQPVYVPSVDVGDWVVIVNARHVAMSGTKSKTKLYRWHTGAFAVYSTHVTGPRGRGDSCVLCVLCVLCVWSCVLRACVVCVCDVAVL